VTEHQLNGAEIGTAFEKMRGKTVAEHVRRKGHTKPSPTSVGGKNFPDTDAAETAAASIEEKNRRVRLLALGQKLRAGIAKIAIDERDGFFAYGNDAFLVSLADTADATGGTIQIQDTKIGEFGDPQSAGIENFEHGAVAQADGSFLVGLSEELFNFFETKIAGKRAANFGRFQMDGRIFRDEFGDLREAKEIAQGDQMTSDRAAFEILAIEAGEKIDQVVPCNRFEDELVLFGVDVEFEHVSAVGGDGVGGEAFFDSNVRKESRDGSRDFHHEPANSSAVSRRVAMP